MPDIWKELLRAHMNDALYGEQKRNLREMLESKEMQVALGRSAMQTLEEAGNRVMNLDPNVQATEIARTQGAVRALHALLNNLWEMTNG
ncbi:MAG: hypothetical protein HC883_00630 [Bdellovibrionaceae bacterium]|nr:hypothetical protein [Pseudobdellovibrionaceae bacterium]